MGPSTSRSPGTYDDAATRHGPPSFTLGLEKSAKNFEVRRFGIKCSPFPSAAKFAGFANAATDKESPNLVAGSGGETFRESLEVSRAS